MSVAFTTGMESDLVILMNPAAGARDDARQEAVRTAFLEAGARPDIRLVHGSEIAAAAHQAAAAGVPIVGVAGGDGSISAAANALAHTRTALLPIPLGTRNHFCARCGIKDISAAAAAWRLGQPDSLHVGRVNDRMFINNASCGFYPKAVRYRERLEALHLPRVPAMWLAGFSVLVEMPLLHVKIALNGGQRRLRTPALWVGIGHDSLRLPEDDDAAHSEAVLEAVSGRTQTRAAIVMMAFRLFRHLKRGIQLRDRRLDVLRAREFTLTARRSIDIALDGEPFRMRSPLRFALEDNALRILAPVV